MHIKDRQITDDIYENDDPIRQSGKEITNCNATRMQPSKHAGTDSVKIRSSRAAQVCLVLLCFLLLTAVIVLSVFIYTNITKCTQERRQLLINISNLTEDRKEQLTRNNNLTEERRQLLIQNGNLIIERQQLSLLGRLTYHQNSLYFISTETTQWSLGKQDCLNRGADLVIINSKVEQDFVKDLTAGAYVWIGLTDSEVEGTWKWVDGTTMKPGFSSWGTGEPNSFGGKNEDCALISPYGWADYPCDRNASYICEKIIFK